MLPRLVISATKKAREVYIKNVTGEEKIDRFHIFTLEPVDATISIDQIRDLQSLFVTQTAGLRLIVIYSFDLATTEAQNSLLKVLEEKTENNLFLLFVENPDSVLTTIQSRTKIIRLHDDQAEDKVDIEKIMRSVDAKNGYFFLNEENHILKTKEELLVRLGILIRYYAQRLRRYPSPTSVLILKRILTTKNEVQNLNCNPQISYDNLLIFISRLVSME